jgi:type I restriction enzyme S subunit
VGKISSFAEVTDCLHSKKPERSEDKTNRILLELNNIRDDGLIDATDIYHISEADYHKWISRMEARGGDCVITNVGRVGASAQMPPGMKAALGRNMTGIRCRKEFRCPTFLIESLRSSTMAEEIERNTDAGTILDALNVKNIPLLRVVMPSEKVLAAFEGEARSLRARMENNLLENNVLSSIRDTLLPKLLSGEIDMTDAERAVGEVV